VRQPSHPAETIDSTVAKIENEIFTQFDKEVPSQVIGELVMRELASINKVAYVRFASVYREFQEVGEFYHVLNEIKDGTAANKKIDIPAVPAKTDADKKD